MRPSTIRGTAAARSSNSRKVRLPSAAGYREMRRQMLPATVASRSKAALAGEPPNPSHPAGRSAPLPALLPDRRAQLLVLRGRAAAPQFVPVTNSGSSCGVLRLPRHPGCPTAHPDDRVIKILRRLHAFRRHVDHSFGASPALWCRLTHPGFHESFGFESVYGRVQRANGALSTRGSGNLFSNRGTVRSIAKACSGGDYQVFELAKHD